MPRRWKWSHGQLFFDLAAMISAGHSENQVRIRGNDCVPAHRNSGVTGCAEDVNPASQRDHLGDPMPTNAWRIEPLEAEYARRVGQAGFNFADLASQFSDELARLFWPLTGVTDNLNIVPDFFDGMRSECYHFRRMHEA